MTQDASDRPPLIPRFGYLDTLRGIAALYVVAFHISRIPKPSLQVPSWLDALVSFGGSGVTLFFVISGFSMCMTWGRHAGTGTPFRSFFITRFFRIAPLFYLWLILSLLRDFAFKGKSGLHSASEVAANAFFLFDFHEPFQSGIVWASWTIGVEMVFYLVFPVIAIYAGTTLLRSALLLLCSVAAAFALQVTLGKAPDFAFLRAMSSDHGFLIYLPAFLVGVVALHLRDWLNSATLDPLRRPVGYLLALASIGGLALVAGRPGLHWYYASVAFYGTLLLAFSMAQRNWLVKPSSMYIGKVSYSLYLNHPNLVYLLAPLYIMVYHINLGATVSFLVCVSLTLLVLLPMSHLTFRFIEEPMMHLGKRLSARPPKAS